MNAYVRPSALGVAEFCPQSADLSSQASIGCEAVMSTAWHALLAGNDTLVGELHPDQRKEVATWGKPTTIEVEGQTLDYDSAEKELHVRVQERDTLITEGTLDFAWVRTVNGRRWAFVSDLKRSTWAISDGADCLQLAAYGHAYAALRSCEGYTPGLWSGTDESWSWGKPVDLTSPEALDLWLRLKRAARNDWRLLRDPDKHRAVTGAHCDSCYGRLKCPAYSMLTSDGPVAELSQENAGQLLIKARAMAELSARIEDNVKAFAARGGVVKDPTTGKVFLPTVMKGRKSLDRESLQAAGIDLDQHQKVGKPFNTFGWRKAV